MITVYGVAVRLAMLACIAIWSPTLIFYGIGVVIFVATMRVCQPPIITPMWRVMGAVQRAVSQRGSTADSREATRSTHILDRYLMRQFAAFMGLGLAVAAALFIVVDLFQTFDRYLRIKPPLLYIFEHF